MDKLKNDITRKTEQKKEEKKNTTSANQNFKKGNSKIEKTFFKQKNQEEIKKKLFFQKTNFRKGFSRKIIVNEQRRYDKDKLFLKKLERRIFF